MRRAIPILRGLAIMSVVLNHANWHVLSQFSPGQLGGYPFVVIDQIGKAAIAAFMFIAGYFIAYATSGGRRDLSWSVVRARLMGLLWPWLIWSLVFVIGQRLVGGSLSVVTYLRTLVTQYYFIPLLAFYYLLAPWIAKAAKDRPWDLLTGAIVVQLLGVALFYARVYWSGFPATLGPWIDLGPLQYLRFAFYFPFGVVCGMSFGSIKDALLRVKTALPWVTLAAFALSVVESSWVYTVGGEIWPSAGDQTKLSSALFSAALLACVAAYGQIKIPAARGVTRIGAHSYGLYLAHYPVLGVIAKMVERLLPCIARYGWANLPLLFALTLGLVLVLMEGVARLPTKRVYRYLFG